MTYQDLLAELFPRLTGGIRWGLERTTRLLASVGHPQNTFQSIHIGGTNGKGSVAALIASTLSESGIRTGLYSSPHLCTFRERIQIDGMPIGEAELVSAAERLWPAVQAEAPTFFETTTALAFLLLAEAGVRLAVIEVGLGGRLDATNVVQPVATILTNVSLDHVQFLGDTVEAVAREKAGIIKPGAPLITAESDPRVLEIFRTAATQLAAPFQRVRHERLHRLETGAAGTAVALEQDDGSVVELWSPLRGAHQAVNMATAFEALTMLGSDARPSEADVRAGFAAVRWPGRLQIERLAGRTWLFDVAHNVAGVATQIAALPALDLPRPLVALVGVLGDKDWRGMVGPLADAVDRVVLTRPPTAPPERAWSPDDVIRQLALSRGCAEPDFKKALELSQRLAGPAGTVLITGSFHTVGDALSSLNLAPHGSDAGLPAPEFEA